MINVGKALNPKQSLLVAVSGILMDPKYVPLLSALHPGGVILFRQARQVIHNMPLDSQGFINEWKGKQLDGTQTRPLSLQPPN